MMEILDVARFAISRVPRVVRLALGFWSPSIVMIARYSFDDLPITATWREFLDAWDVENHHRDCKVLGRDPMMPNAAQLRSLELGAAFMSGRTRRIRRAMRAMREAR